MKERKVAAIENGMVIDHIPPKNTFKVLDIINVKSSLVTVGNNLYSRKMGLKGVVKIAERHFSQEELNKISILAPNAKVSIIENFKVIKKMQIEIPKNFINIIQCRNPNCISRNQSIKSIFDVISENPLKVSCHFCEHSFDKSELKLL